MCRGERQSFHGEADWGAGLPDGLRPCEVPEPDGVLFAEDGHVSYPGRYLHAGLPVLQREEGPSAAARPGRAARVAEAAKELGLKHVVITCVTHDDLPDSAREHFVRTIEEVRRALGPKSRDRWSRPAVTDENGTVPLQRRKRGQSPSASVH